MLANLSAPSLRFVGGDLAMLLIIRVDISNDEDGISPMSLDITWVFVHLIMEVQFIERIPIRHAKDDDASINTPVEFESDCLVLFLSKRCPQLHMQASRWVHLHFLNSKVSDFASKWNISSVFHVIVDELLLLLDRLITLGRCNFLLKDRLFVLRFFLWRLLPLQEVGQWRNDLSLFRFATIWQLLEKLWL